MIDLHLHSTFSDGSLTPEQLASEAEKIGLTAIALTDHDNIDGVPSFLEACAHHAVRGVPGVEISVDYPKGSMHMLGYFIDFNSPALIARIDKLKAGRAGRNADILKKLNRLGMPLTMAEIAAFAGQDNVGRLHFAQALAARGYVTSIQDAFDRYLAKGKAGYAERRHFTPIHGIEIIRQAGGLAVLSHPFTLELSPQALEDLVKELVEAGLQGIEVYYPQHNAARVRQYSDLAKRFNLAATGGTDFHGSAMPDLKIGCGFGALNVPDSVMIQLDERRCGKAESESSHSVIPVKTGIQSVIHS